MLRPVSEREAAPFVSTVLAAAEVQGRLTAQRLADPAGQDAARIAEWAERNRREAYKIRREIKRPPGVNRSPMKRYGFTPEEFADWGVLRAAGYSADVAAQMIFKVRERESIACTPEGR